MKTFIQTRNNIGFAILNTSGSEPDHSLTPDHTNAIDITGHENPESLLRKQYNPENQTWSDAQIFRVADINAFGDIVEIRRTVFEHEIDPDTIVMPENVDYRWKYVNGEWIEPVFIEPVQETPAPVLTEEQQSDPE